MTEYSHICTACGYEGKPVRAPDDSVGEDPSFIIGAAEKLIFMMTFLPIKLRWIGRLAKRGKAKNCPNCGLPLMVKLSSDAGWLAKRKLDIKLGLLVLGDDGIARPNTAVKKLLPDVVAPAPDPGKLADVDTLLNEPPVHAVEMKEEVVVEKPLTKPVTKKPVDPDQF